MKQHLQRTLPFLYRGAALLILCGFFLPWCAGASGFDFAKTRAYWELWGIVGVGILLFLLPLFPSPRIRALLGAILGLAVAGGMIPVIRRFGIFREYGIWVTFAGGVGAVLSALMEGFALYLQKRTPGNAPQGEGSSLPGGKGLKPRTS